MPGDGNTIQRAASALGLVLALGLVSAPSARAQGGLPLYSVSPSDNQLRSVDPLTGKTVSSEPISLSGLKIEGAAGLAVHPQTGQLFALLKVAGQSGYELVTLNPQSGAATSIGDAGGVLAALRFGQDGTLYALSGGATATRPVWHTLDPRTAAVTLAGSIRPRAEEVPKGSPITTPWRDGFFLRAEADGELVLVEADGARHPLSRLDHASAGLALAGPLPACSPRPALFGVAHEDEFGPSLFYSIDPASGAATLIGPTGFERLTALDFGPAKTLFAIGERMDGSGENLLLTIDFCTGLGTPVGLTGLRPGESVADLAYRKADQTLFAYIEPSGELATVNLATGRIIRLGAVPSGGAGNGVAFAGDGSLYHSNGSSLSRLNPASLNQSLAAPLAFWEGGGAMQVRGIDISSAGELFALVEDSGQRAWLATVNVVSGAVTPVGPTQTGLAGLAALDVDPDLILSMADSPDPVAVVTGNLTYTVTVANAGPDQATGVVITDTLPTSVNFGSATATMGTCSQSGITVTCNIGTVALQASATVTIVVIPQTPGITITNTATVTLNETDPDTSNNTRSVDTEVVDFDFSVSPTSVTVTRGNSAIYTVTLMPIGSRYDFTIALSCEMLPANTTCTFVPASAVPGGGSVTSTLSVITTAPGSASLRPPLPTPLYAVWLLGPLGLLVLGAGRRRRGRAILGLVLIILVLQAGCGGSDEPMMPVTNPGTPVGTHTFTIRGATGILNHSATVTLVVQ